MNQANTNFSCLECDDGYLRDKLGYMCKERVNTPSACEVYDPTEDICIECKKNNYLSTNNKDCISQPDGLLGCTAYAIVEDKRTCV